jgi:predicted transcriptional regulator
MAITLQLSPEQEARLRTVAGQLNVAPEALAETAVRDLLAQPDEAFLKLAQAIVDENRELYERLR